MKLLVIGLPAGGDDEVIMVRATGARLLWHPRRLGEYSPGRWAQGAEPPFNRLGLIPSVWQRTKHGDNAGADKNAAGVSAGGVLVAG